MNASERGAHNGGGGPPGETRPPGSVEDRLPEPRSSRGVERAQRLACHRGHTHPKRHWPVGLAVAARERTAPAVSHGCGVPTAVVRVDVSVTKPRHRRRTAATGAAPGAWMVPGAPCEAPRGHAHRLPRVARRRLSSAAHRSAALQRDRDPR